MNAISKNANATLETSKAESLFTSDGRQALSRDAVNQHSPLHLLVLWIWRK